MRTLLFAAALCLSACSSGPRGPDAFAGEPLRTETLDNGVEIATFVEGRGEAAIEHDRVVVHYTLYLEDGTKVDSSHDGKPLSFLILQDSSLIDGIQHGALGMRVGELRRVTVPPQLGYGERSLGKIPAKATLRFDMELMELHPNPYD